MAGDYGKNRALDYAYWANLGGKEKVGDAEAEQLNIMLGHHRYQFGQDERQALDAALIQCENLYRVACLLAYGNGLAGFCDIAKFVQVVEEPYASDLLSDGSGEQQDEDAMLKLTVTLPYSRWFDDARIPDALSTPKRYHRILNPNVPTFLCVEYSAFASKHYQVFEMLYHPDICTVRQGNISEWREPYKIIGQVIANAHTFGNYLGMYDGKPLFEERCVFDFLWQTIAELADKQAPGICPVCGKVIDRRRNKKGGHPKKTCDAHSDKFQNMKKALQKNGDPDMRFSDKCEEAVRQQRWRDASLNERPLHFEL